MFTVACAALPPTQRGSDNPRAPLYSSYLRLWIHQNLVHCPVLTTYDAACMVLHVSCYFLNAARPNDDAVDQAVTYLVVVQAAGIVYYKCIARNRIGEAGVVRQALCTTNVSHAIE